MLSKANTQTQIHIRLMFYWGWNYERWLPDFTAVSCIYAVSLMLEVNHFIGIVKSICMRKIKIKIKEIHSKFCFAVFIPRAAAFVVQFFFLNID